MIIDLIVLGLVLWSLIGGLNSGLIMGVTSLLGLFLSAILASRHLDFLYTSLITLVKIDNFPTDVNENYYVYILAYLLFIFFFYLLIYYCAYMIKSIFGALMLGWVDKIFGALFGVVKGFVISILFLTLLAFLGKFNSKLKSALDRSESIKVLPDISILVKNILPEEVKDSIESYIDSVKDMLIKDVVS